jgi:hypothetical protein
MTILVLQHLEPFDLRHIHAAELRFPAIEGLLTDARLATDLCNLQTGLLCFSLSGKLAQGVLTSRGKGQYQ